MPGDDRLKFYWRRGICVLLLQSYMFTLVDERVVNDKNVSQYSFRLQLGE